MYSCEIEDFVESRLCKPCVMLRSRVLRCAYALMKDTGPWLSLVAASNRVNTVIFCKHVQPLIFLHTETV